MDLLIAQCSDLEALLELARRETSAVEGNDFGGLVTIASDRATLGQRLESYHRQIAELRTTMAGVVEPLLEDPVAQETVRLAVEIQTLDARTKAMLIDRRTETRNALANLEQGRRNSIAYLSDDARRGLMCDRRG